ncbi:acetyl-CoA synthetase [Halobacteriales archaeon QH_1_68_42]|nr:MAG: acetyl-CoA synthetase [Halobacteriales archaeon QH_1_68_42]
MGELARLFGPERVAVVGATESEGSVGRAVTENLLAEFDGEVFAVNPTKDEVLGLPCHDALSDLSDVDVAVVAVPVSAALDVIREAGETGIRNVVVITAGFGEAGTEGAERERELREIAAEYDLNLVGPNSLGIMNTARGLNATFGPESPAPGSISFMSQSGAFVTAVVDRANDRDLGFKDVVSVGNKAVLDESDFVAEWGDDPDTDVILGYLEDVVDGRSFLEAAREVTRETPMVVVKSGRTEAGASAAASHTGAMAGSEQAYEAAFDQAGVLRVETVQELFDYASILAGQPLPETDGVAIVTNAGGPGVMTTDAVGDAGLSPASFADETVDAFQEALPDGANVYNPVDIIGDAPVERFREALDIALADPNVGATVVVACPTATFEFADLAEVVAELQAEYETPTAVTLMGGSSTRAASERLAEAGIPTYFDPARAVASLDALREYREVRDRERVEPRSYDVDRERARSIIRTAADRGATRLGVEAMDLLAAYGIPIPEGEVVSGRAAAAEAAERIGDGEDVVMKIVSPDILHKSDIGGVAVGVPPREAGDTYEALVTRARNYQPDATILGVQVQKLRNTDAGVETIVGINRDPSFGPLVLFGLGGIFVEVLEDATVRVAPVAEPDVREMLDDIEAAPLLRGARGRDPVDETALVEVIGRVSQLATDFPAIVELDVNPLVATADGATALDLRLTIDPEKA